MSDEHPETDFPWNFYFNGELMPKWGACWAMGRISDYLEIERDVSGEFGHRAVYGIDCRIDHVGNVESADPDVFIYAIQEVLCILLGNRDTILERISGEPPELYANLVAAAFRMRELVLERGCAFWTSGYEQDRVRLVEVMRRCQLPLDAPEYLIPPHIALRRLELTCAREWQVRKLHQLAQSGRFDKATRKRLNEMRSEGRRGCGGSEKLEVRMACWVGGWFGGLAGVLRTQREL